MEVSRYQKQVNTENQNRFKQAHKAGLLDWIWARLSHNHLALKQVMPLHSVICLNTLPVTDGASVKEMMSKMKPQSLSSSGEGQESWFCLGTENQRQFEVLVTLSSHAGLKNHWKITDGSRNGDGWV